MYNSFVVALIMKVVKAVQKIYRKSYIRKIVYYIKTQLTKMAKGSVVLQLLLRDGVVFTNSITYRIISGFFGLLNLFFKKLFSINEKITLGSKFSDGLKEYSKDISTGLLFMYHLLGFTGAVLIISRLIGYSFISPVIGIIMLAIGIFGLLINGHEIAAIENSLVANYILDIFRLDKDGENWW